MGAAAENLTWPRAAERIFRSSTKRSPQLSNSLECPICFRASCRITQTAVCGTSSPAYKLGTHHSSNPTNGSLWILQVQPTNSGLTTLLIPQTAVCGYFKSCLLYTSPSPRDS